MKNIFKIIKISKPLHSIVWILATLIVSTAVIELITPILSKFIVDEIVTKVKGGGGDIGILTWLITLSFALSFLSIVLTTITERLGDHFAGELRKFLTEKFYHKVLSLPQSYFDSELSGKIVNQLSRGIISIQQFLNTSTNFILPTFLQSFFTLGVMAYYSVPVAIFTFSMFPIYLLLSYYSTKKWGEEEVKKNKIEDLTRGRIQEVIANMKLVKSFNNEANEFITVSHNLKESNKIYARQSMSFHIFDFLRNLSLIIIFTIINVIVFYGAFKGDMTIGTMVLLLQLLNQARRPLFAMSFILTQVQNAESGSKEFFEIVEIPTTETIDKKDSAELIKIKEPTIEFKNVSFKYEQSEMVLKDISFELRKNEKVALVGHSGVGKSTIVNLILKFYNPTGGDIYIADKNYSKLSAKFVRHNISLVFQENELFASTIRENVSYGTESAEEDIMEALKLANAYDFVMKLPKGIESEVGERGVRLSGGQKQRIQIARAILKNAPILVLDEATSSLDAKSEKEVQDGLENLMKNKLVLIIAHRFSTIQNVNRIIVLDKGSIVDTGTPQELSRKKGIYQDLLNYQIEGNKKLLEKFELY